MLTMSAQRSEGFPYWIFAIMHPWLNYIKLKAMVKVLSASINEGLGPQVSQCL